LLPRTTFVKPKEVKKKKKTKKNDRGEQEERKRKAIGAHDERREL